MCQQGVTDKVIVFTERTKNTARICYVISPLIDVSVKTKSEMVHLDCIFSGDDDSVIHVSMVVNVLVM